MVPDESTASMGVVGDVVVPQSVEYVGAGTPVTPATSNDTIIEVLLAELKAGIDGAMLGPTGVGGGPIVLYAADTADVDTPPKLPAKDSK